MLPFSFQYSCCIRFVEIAILIIGGGESFAVEHHQSLLIHTVKRGVDGSYQSHFVGYSIGVPVIAEAKEGDAGGRNRCVSFFWMGVDDGDGRFLCAAAYWLWNMQTRATMAPTIRVTNTAIVIITIFFFILKILFI